MQTYRPIVIETAVAATFSIVIAALLSPSDLGLGNLFPHPVWLAVLVMAARYGNKGLMVGVPLSWGVVLLTAVVMRIPALQVLARTTSGADLGALIGVVLVGAVATIHERRHVKLAETVEALKERSLADRGAVNELREAAVVLRARADRLETSLTFLRDVASRLEGDDAIAAAQAALELAMSRIGARAGTAQMVHRDGLRVVASIGTWTPDGAGLDLSRDQTVALALSNARPSRAFDLNQVSPADSDLAVPIIDKAGAVKGILALRGVPNGGSGVAALHDLVLVAAWCGKSLVKDGAGSIDVESRHGGQTASELSRQELPRSISNINV